MQNALIPNASEKHDSRLVRRLLRSRKRGGSGGADDMEKAGSRRKDSALAAAKNIHQKVAAGARHLNAFPYACATRGRGRSVSAGRILGAIVGTTSGVRFSGRRLSVALRLTFGRYGSLDQHPLEISPMLAFCWGEVAKICFCAILLTLFWMRRWG